MNAIASIAAAPSPTFDSWIDQGRDLAAQRRNVDWAIADWLATGQQQFGNQLEFGILSERLGIDPKRLKQAEKIAIAFPEHLRAGDVPFEVHAYVAALPEEQRLSTLQRASREHWGEREAKRAVTEHKQQVAMFEDEDTEARWATEMWRCWNRAPSPDAREYAYELIRRSAENGFGVINEDEVDDA